jgi:hypothetical protein
MAGFGSDIEGTVELVEPLVDQAEPVASAVPHPGGHERNQIAGKGQHEGHDGRVLHEAGGKERRRI